MSRFSNQTTYQTQLKQTASDFISTMNPFYSNLNDTSLVSTMMHFRNAFSFNQSDAIWGLDLIYTQSKNKILSVNGFESAEGKEWQFSGRWRIIPDVTLKLTYYHALNGKNTVYFALKNYRILSNTLEPILSYQYNNRLTTSITYAYIQKINTLGVERSFTHKLSTEVNIIACPNEALSSHNSAIITSDIKEKLPLRLLLKCSKHYKTDTMECVTSPIKPLYLKTCS